ncbi:hypothetical protein RR48_00117 [Papilio machaon]|uniref:Uncharacterized protein n=1 Tax=Papilio machaon TaxID=76193 RepID=A0A0N0PFS3_PAPMA|nr:hypothetical protein RR48_00117 [Papilio machaon]
MGRGAVKMHFAYLWIYVRGELNKHVKVLKQNYATKIQKKGRSPSSSMFLDYRTITVSFRGIEQKYKLRGRKLKVCR